MVEDWSPNLRNGHETYRKRDISRLLSSLTARIYPAIAPIFDEVFYSHKYCCDGFIYFVGLLVGVMKIKKKVEFNIWVI